MVGEYCAHGDSLLVLAVLDNPRRNVVTSLAQGVFTDYLEVARDYDVFLPPFYKADTRGCA